MDGYVVEEDWDAEETRKRNLKTDPVTGKLLFEPCVKRRNFCVQDAERAIEEFKKTDDPSSIIIPRTEKNGQIDDIQPMVCVGEKFKSTGEKGKKERGKGRKQ